MIEMLHIVPLGSIFVNELISTKGIDAVITYDLKQGFFRRLLSILRVYRIIMVKKPAEIKFHWVPFIYLLPLRILYRGRVHFQYWGGDIYQSLGGTGNFEKHCMQSETLPKEYFAPSPERLKSKVRKVIHQAASLYVFNSANKITMTYKQYRLVRYCYFKVFRKISKVAWQDVQFYGQHEKAGGEDHAESAGKIKWGSEANNNNKVLVCHSGTPDLHVDHTAHHLKQFVDSNEISIYGFLSYGGGSSEDRDHLCLQYKALFCGYVKSIEFERDFFNHDDLNKKLDDVLAIFLSCYRDEGFSTILRFLQRGGVCIFPKRSINYHHFKRLVPNKVLTIDEFKVNDIATLKSQRQARPLFKNRNIRTI